MSYLTVVCLMVALVAVPTVNACGQYPPSNLVATSSWSNCCKCVTSVDQPSQHTGCLAPATSSGTAQIQQVDIAGILNAHNTFRSTITPKPVNPLPPLKWSDDLACVAMHHAMQATQDHDTYPNRQLINDGWTMVGQNLAAASPGFSDLDLIGADFGWASEWPSYNYSPGNCTCQSGQECGHATQMAWNTTLYVGCGYVMFPTPTDPDFAGQPEYILVCNYGPAGNVNNQCPY